jgi:caffeoyl-CoA O-methyltransferase
MRPGAVLVVDNVLRGGRVIAAEQDPDTAAIVAFNDIVAADDRVESVMIPLADGLTIARVKP